MNNYSFSDAAIQELKEICDYIAQYNPLAANNLFDAIRQKCKLVANFPYMGKSYDKLGANIKGFIVDDYIIFYYPRKDGIDIIRIMSGYQDLETLFSDEN